MLRLFVEAYDTGDAPLKTFILRSIKHHVAQAHQPAVALHQDELMMRVLTHSGSFLVARAVAGIGEERMQATIEACEAGAEWWAAAREVAAAALAALAVPEAPEAAAAAADGWRPST